MPYISGLVSMSFPCAADCQGKHAASVSKTARISQASTRSSTTQRPLPSVVGPNHTPPPPPPYSLDGGAAKLSLPPPQVEDTLNGGSEVAVHLQESRPGDRPPPIPYHTKPAASRSSTVYSNNQVPPSNLGSPSQEPSQTTPTLGKPELIPIPHPPSQKVVPLAPPNALYGSRNGTNSQQSGTWRPHAHPTVISVPPLEGAGAQQCHPATVISRPSVPPPIRIVLTGNSPAATQAEQSSNRGTTRVPSRPSQSTSTTREYRYGGNPLPFPALPTVSGPGDRTLRAATAPAPRSDKIPTIDRTTANKTRTSRGGVTFVGPPKTLSNTSRPWYYPARFGII